LDYFVYFLKN